MFVLFYNSTSQRPERLISKLKTMNIEEVARGGPRITVVRQPRYSSCSAMSLAILANKNH